VAHQYEVKLACKEQYYTKNVDEQICIGRNRGNQPYSVGFLINITWAFLGMPKLLGIRYIYHRKSKKGRVDLLKNKLRKCPGRAKELSPEAMPLGKG